MSSDMNRQCANFTKSFESSLQLAQHPRTRTREKPIVLEEDEFIEALDTIIERDFFPNLSIMKSQIRVPGIPLPSRLTNFDQTPSTFETPIGTFGGDSHLQESGTDALEAEQSRIKTHLSLNAFLARYTSEDNASFDHIMKEAERRHREKYPWLYNALPSTTSQLMIESGGVNNQLDWPYKNQNALMFVPEGLKMEDQISTNKHITVCHENTRFTRNPFNEHLNKSARAEAALSNQRGKSGKIGIDGKELVDDTSEFGGFSLVPLTPSITPGVNSTPLMTWGEIEGTPYSIDGGETPLLIGSSLQPGTPQFKIPDVPERDKIGHALVDKITKRSRDKKKEALKQAQYLRNSPLISSGGKTLIESLGSMSPAAQKLATFKLGINMNIDKELRGSYSPAISRTTPDRSPFTPSPVPRANKSTTLSTKPRESTSRSSRTDNLLKMPRKTNRI